MDGWMDGCHSLVPDGRYLSYICGRVLQMDSATPARGDSIVRPAGSDAWRDVTAAGTRPALDSGVVARFSIAADVDYSPVY